jgi:cobalt-zinc-cadmium resistance protein CzcA
MIDRLVTFCLARGGLALTFLAVLALLGYFSWKTLIIEAYPDIGDTTSQVVTEFPGNAAEEVEQQVTIPLERALSGLPGMHVMRSKSTFGLSLITIVFQDGVEDYWSRDRIRERLADVELPEGAVVGLDPLTSPTGEFFRYVLESNLRDPFELKELHDWVVMPRLTQISGVAEVTGFGGEPTQFQVILDPNRLLAYGLSYHDVVDAIAVSSANAGGSMVYRGEQSFVIRGLGVIRELEDLGLVVVAESDGVPVLVRDLGEVRFGGLERVGVVGKDDDDDVVTGIVLLLKGEDPGRVLRDIHRAVDDLNQNLLPPDTKVVPYLDRTDLIEATLATVARTLLAGMGLVTLVLVVFVGSLRGALLVALVIPFSLLFAFLLMKLTDVPANLLSLGAIGFGMLVDGAIVLMEVILRRREANPDRPLTAEDARGAALEVARPIFFATLIIVASYLPIFALERVEAKLFHPMVFTIGYSLLGAVLFALAAMPTLAFLTYRRPGKLFRNPLMDWLTRRYERTLEGAITRPRRAIVPAILAAVLAVGLGGTVGREFLPHIDEGSIWLQVKMPPGISLEKAMSYSAELRRAVREFPEVSTIVTQLGRNEDGTDPFTTSHIEAFVGLRPYREWGGNKQALITRMERRLKEVPGITVGFTQPMIDGVYDKIAGAHSELVVKVFGQDFAETRRIATEIKNVLAEIRGAVDLLIDQEPPLPQIQIHVDRLAAARYGINASDIAEFIQGAIGGAAVGQVFLGDRVYDIAVRYQEDARNSPEAIGRLTLPSSTGAHVPLAAFADIRVDSGESMISREMNRRHMTVMLNLRGRDLASFMVEAQREIAARVSYDPTRIDVVWGGQFENQRRAQARMAVIVPGALLLIFLLLFIGFGNARHAGIILITVPLSVMGGLAALHLRDMTLNVSSAVGFLAVFGVAVQNGVIMVANLNRWRTLAPTLELAVIRGARERLRPVLITAATTIFGLLPAAFTHAIGSDVQRPFATVVVAGLLVATLLTMLVLPAAYYLVEKRFGPPAGQPTHSPRDLATS